MTPRPRTLFLMLAAASGLALAAAPGRAALGVALVKDPWNIAQTTATVRELARQYRTMVDQLDEAKAQVAALTSKSGMGKLFDGAAERASRRYMPDAWANARRYEASAPQMRDLYRLDQPAALEPAGAHAADAQRHVRETGTALAVLAASEAMIDAAATRRDTYEGLMARIDGAADTKAAADLANRLAAEAGLTQNELVRAAAMHAQVAAQQEVRIAAARAASARAAVRTRVNLSGGTYAPAS